jgi:hypothetical protein
VLRASLTCEALAAKVPDRPMKPGYWIPGLVLGALGAILAFALKSDHDLIGVRLRPLGVIVLVVGGLFLLWGLLRWWEARNPPARTAHTTTSQLEEIRSIGGLVAVAIGVGAVAALSVVVITTQTGLDNTSIVAISTSAFGVVSTVVGSFVGIKVGTDQAGKAIEEVKASGTAVGAMSAQLSVEQRAKAKQAAVDGTDIAAAAS